MRDMTFTERCAMPVWHRPPFEVDLLDGSKVLVACHSAERWGELEASLVPFIASFGPVFDAGRLPSLDEALGLMAPQLSAVLPCVLEATGLDLAGLEELGTTFAECVLGAWWATNGAYHVARFHFARLDNLLGGTVAGGAA